MKNFFDVRGKVAVITGGNRGLGRAMAEGFADCGADVAIISTKHAPEVEEALKARGVRGKSYAFNLGDFAGYDALIAEIVSDFGTIDILINNAGVQRRADAVEFPEAEWDFVVDLDMKAPFLLCQKAGRIMLEKGYGKIINLASLLSFQGGLRVPAYAAAKAGVSGFTKSLANEWAQHGVNINAIAPGYMATEMNEALLVDEDRNSQILARIPAGRWGTPDDLVGTALFLASPASDYVNGFTIAVDGGWLGR